MKTYSVTVDENNSIRWQNDKGELHRENGPAIEYGDGGKEWLLCDKLHREDGPAVEWSDGHKEWHINGQRHREDGPAIEYTDGINCWFINGMRFTEEEFNKKTSKPDCTKRTFTIGVTINGKDYFRDSSGNYVTKKE